MTAIPQHRSAVHVMSVGLALTTFALALPFLDRSVLADHIRSGYPTYSTAEIGTAVTTYLVILAVVGMLGIAGWITAIVAARQGRRWARWFASAVFVAAVAVALSGLAITDTSGDVGLAPLLGWVGVLPCVAGLAAVALLWRRPRSVELTSR